MKKIGTFIGGMLAGALLFGGGAAYATGILAEPCSHQVYVDGKEVYLDAYLIHDNTYVKLRDVGQAVDFNVYWDGAVRVDSGAGYTGEAPSDSARIPDVSPEPLSSREEASYGNAIDYSAYANPDVFTGVYSREAYNAAYEVWQGLKQGELLRTGTWSIATGNGAMSM